MRSSSLVLYIDTSSSILYSALVKDNQLLEQVNEDLKKELSKKALNIIHNMFKKANCKVNDVDKIIVVNGPGSFTGIRVGITIAKVLAWSLNKEITTITSLEAMALSSDFNGYKIPLIDARRNHVYAAIFDKENQKIMKENYISLEALKIAVENLNENVRYITNDFDGNEYEKYKPNILKIVNNYQDKEPINPHDVNPEYFKHTEAEENKGMIFDD